MPKRVIPCPHCAEMIPARASRCPRCGGALAAAAAGAGSSPPSANQKILVGSGLLLLVVVAVILTFYYASEVVPDAAAASTALPAVGTHRIEYRLEGTNARAAVTYSNADGGTEQATVSLPYTATLTVAAGEFVYLAAQNEGAGGTIVCEIWLDGALWKTAQARGAYGFATCSGMVGEE